MKAVILAGGFGTRLRPLTCNIPKPMISIANQPVMEHIIRLLKKHQLREILALVYYQSEVIKDYFRQGKNWKVRIDYLEEKVISGTAGAVKNAQTYLHEPFVVISGDILTDFNLSQAVQFHQKKGALATIILVRVKNPLPFGIVVTDEEGRISRFLEKPTWGEVFSDTINTGIYVLQPEVLDFIPPKREFDFSEDLFPLLLAEKKPLFGYLAKGYWQDIGDLDAYHLCQQDVLAGKVEVEVQGERLARIGRDVWLDKGCQIHPSVAFSGTVILGHNCLLERNVKLRNSIIGHQCLLGEGCSIRNSILWDGVEVLPEAELVECVVEKNSLIKKRALLWEGVVVGENCLIGSGSKIRPQVKIWPNKRVEDETILSQNLVWEERWLKSVFNSYSAVVGLTNVEVTPDFAAKLGACYGALLGKESDVLTSRDGHPSSRMIKRAFISGFMSVGVNVKDLRLMPVPVVRYKLKNGEEKGGIYVHKSPLDPELTEVKFLGPQGRDLLPGEERSIEQLFLRGDFRRVSSEQVGRITIPYGVIDGYGEGFLNHLKVKLIQEAKFKIVIDYAFGSGSLAFPSLLGHLNCEVISLNAHIDEKKLSPSLEEFNQSLRQLSDIVYTLKADLGVMFDPDAEKVFLVDNQGRIIPGELALAVTAFLFLKAYQPRKIVVPVTAPRIVEKMARNYRARVLHAGTSYGSLIRMAVEEGAEMVGEVKGGFIYAEFLSAFDAMFATAKLLELLAKEGKSLSEVVNSIPEPFIAKEHLSCPWDQKGMVMRQLMQETKGEKRELIDGIKIYKNGGWVIILPDGHRALFHINAEADTKEKAQGLVKEYREKIRSWLK